MPNPTKRVSSRSTKGKRKKQRVTSSNDVIWLLPPAAPTPTPPSTPPPPRSTPRSTPPPPRSTPPTTPPQPRSSALAASSSTNTTPPISQVRCSHCNEVGHQRKSSARCRYYKKPSPRKETSSTQFSSFKMREYFAQTDTTIPHDALPKPDSQDVSYHGYPYPGHELWNECNSQWSITVTNSNGDIPITYFKLMSQFLKYYTQAGVVATERGSSKHQLHLQVALRMRYPRNQEDANIILGHEPRTKTATFTNALVMMLKFYLGVPTGYKVQAKVFAPTQTMTKMTGYCLKGVGKKFSRLSYKGFTPAALVEGIKSYSGHCSHYTKGSTSIKKSNLFNLCFNYWSTNLDPLTIPLPRLITIMIRSGEFIPDAAWALSSNGFSLNPHTVRSFWAIITSRQAAVKESDVVDLFFKSANSTTDIPTFLDAPDIEEAGSSYGSTSFRSYANQPLYRGFEESRTSNVTYNLETLADERAVLLAAGTEYIATMRDPNVRDLKHAINVMNIDDWSNPLEDYRDEVMNPEEVPVPIEHDDVEERAGTDSLGDIVHEVPPNQLP